jgi:glycine/D-amino acid oxidase-like deaminating enzyme
MTPLRLGRSYWLDRTDRRGPTSSPLRGAHETDVVIVGGGVTGCACAYLLARRGVQTILLEAKRIGHGSTAASTALLMQEPDVDLVALAERYGHAAATRVWKTSRRAVRDLVNTVARLAPGAATPRVPSVYFSRDPSEVRSLLRELAARHRAGIGGRWLSPAALKRATGIEGVGAILTQGNAQVDPLRSCLAFARAADAAGARLCTHSRVRRIKPTATGVQIELGRGRVRANRVIIATGYATPEFKPLAGRFRMVTTYVIATPRLPNATRARLGLGEVMLWDTERPYHYARWTPDHRLLFGGRDRPAKPGAASRRTLTRGAADLVADLTSLYPALDDVQPEYAWEGLFAATPDGLPYIGAHRRYPRHLFALGYGGNGMSFGFLAAQMLTRAIASASKPDDTLFGFGRPRR